MALSSFATRVIGWQQSQGRHHLPWQGTRDPYRVWVSEIMLQQTQVKTVLGYFPRFMQTFPSVQALARAAEDDVMRLWSGLGYYSRARNLHRAAQMVVEQWQGHFPQDAQLLAQLPGVGRSTANAIAAFCFGAREAIFDANVQRVLTRHWAFDQDMARPQSVKELWMRAEQLLPKQKLDSQMPSYTQGMMDLGALVCTSRAPTCQVCPVAGDCQALQLGLVEQFPIKTKKLKRRAVSWFWLVLLRETAGGWQTLVYKRPSKGVWPSLFGFPTFEDATALQQKLASLHLPEAQWQPGFRHALTHLELTLTPVLTTVNKDLEEHVEPFALEMGLQWVNMDKLLNGQKAVPAPMLDWLRSQHWEHAEFALQ